MAQMDYRQSGNSHTFSRVSLILRLVRHPSYKVSSSNFGTITIVPAVEQILHHFHTDGKFYVTFLVSIWELGEAVGQLFVGPAAELFGRMPVFLAGNVLFLICSVASALAVNVHMLTAFRFLNGTANTTLTLGPSIIGDMFIPEQRGRAIAISIAIPLLGPFVAPIVGSYVSARLGWRWTIWIVAIAMAAVTALSIPFFKETYRVRILQRKTEKLQRQSTSINYQSKYKSDRTQSSAALASLFRPVKMLFTSPQLFLVAIYSGYTYGISYLMLTTLASVMQGVYGFSNATVGNAFIARG